MEGLEFDQIRGTEWGWLERKFEKEEGIQVVRDMEGDKALGMDGFSMAFLHHYWRVVEKDIFAIFEDFYFFYKLSLKSFINIISLKNLSLLLSLL